MYIHFAEINPTDSTPLRRFTYLQDDHLVLHLSNIEITAHRYYNDARSEPQVVLFDGWLSESENGPTDQRSVELMLGELYQRRGVDFARILDGEFALALYSSHTRTTHLCRDALGVRSLYYSVQGQTLLISTDLRALWHRLGCPRCVNVAHLASYLTLTEPAETTPFRDIHAVPPGAVVTLSENFKSNITYWWPDESLNRQPGLITLSDATSEFRRLFLRSIEKRCSRAKTVFCELSGGIDSSSVLSAAVCRSRAVGGCTPVAFSWVYDGCLDGDERPWIRDMEGFLGVMSHTFFEYLISRDPLETIAHLQTLNPMMLTGDVRSFLAQYESDSARRIVLTGEGGDHLMLNGDLSRPDIADAVAAGQIWGALTASVEWSTANAQPLLRTLVFALSHSLRRRELGPMIANRIPWLTREARRACHDIAKVRIDRVSKYSSAQVEHALLTVWAAQGIIGPGYHRQLYNAKVSHPYLSRPLVEFVCTLPHSLKVSTNPSRLLQRAAMRGLLPESVRTRESKGGTDGFLTRWYARQAGLLHSTLVPSACICDIGLVDPLRLSEITDRLAYGGVPFPASVLRLVILELWLRWLKDAQLPQMINPEGLLFCERKEVKNYETATI